MTTSKFKPPRPTASKDISMISLIPKWSGAVKSMRVHEFIETVERAARVGNWSDANMVQVATLNLADTAKTFYLGCKELHNPGITWVHFKNIFQDRFRDAHTDQYHFLQLQTDIMGEKALRNLQTDARYYVRKQFLFLRPANTKHTVYATDAERRLLTAFIFGLSGQSGQQVRFTIPQTLHEAV
jgi:hypothetical protein